MSIEKFAWLPTVIKCGGNRRALIWLQHYQLKEYSYFPILCDCYQHPCVHTQTEKGYYKMPADYKKLGLLTIEWYV